MTFHEKLKRRVTELGLNKAKAAREVGLPESTINSYLTKPTAIPRADIALKLARALQVPIEWLIDDQQGMPPPAQQKGGATLGHATDDELLFELATRYRRECLNLIHTVEFAKKVDWQGALEELRSSPEGSLPYMAGRALAILKLVQNRFSRVRQDFDIDFFSVLNHERLPGSNLPLPAFGLIHSGHVWREVEQIPFIREFGEAARSHHEWVNSDEKRSADEYERRSSQYFKRITDLGESPIDKPMNPHEKKKDEKPKPDQNREST